MDIRTIDWQNGSIKIIDQTKLPGELKYINIRDLRSLWKAIRGLKVRGAPALGAAAGLGVYLGVKDSRARDSGELIKEIKAVNKYLGSCRPTARNLFWGLERMQKTAVRFMGKPVSFIKKMLFEEAEKIIKEDREACRRIGFYGEKLFKDKDTVLTVCNAGILATIDYGTALGVIYNCYEQGKPLKVFACETRPLLQGSRLTAWELRKKGVDVTLVCDNMAATLMKEGKITKVIAGADRIASNGDAANKIGTYNLAILSRYHKIPFYIAAPVSTFDLSIKNRDDIRIEERPGSEVTGLVFKEQADIAGIKVYNPAFDITPHALITAFITDKGIIKPPFEKNIKKLLVSEK